MFEKEMNKEELEQKAIKKASEDSEPIKVIQHEFEPQLLC